MRNDIKMLKLFYAGILADSVGNYEKFGILDKVTEKKAVEQKVAAKKQLEQLDIHTPEELFYRFSNIFGCIQWQTKEKNDNIVATGTSCLLCGIAKKMGIARPCDIFCINPFKALACALEPAYQLKVNETLWQGNRCEFELTPVKDNE